MLVSRGVYHGSDPCAALRPVGVCRGAVLAACGGGDGGNGGSTTEPPATTVGSVSVTLGATQLLPGATTSASAEVRSSAGAVLSGRNITWTSSAPSVATVDAAGGVVAVSAGTTAITASSEGKSGSATLTVTLPPVATVALTLAQSSVVAGSTTAATVLLRDNAGNTLTGRAITYTSSSPGVATIDNNGSIIAISAGTTTITATSEGQSGSAPLTVLPPPVATVTVSLQQTTVVLGDGTTASAVLRDAGGSTLSGRTISWSSSNPAVANVSTSGVISSASVGTTTITATSEGIGGSATLTVIPAPVASISVSLAQPSLQVGNATSATAVLRDANGAVLTDRSVAWSTSNTAVASVSAGGVVTALAGGTANIVATSEGKTGSALLTVTLPPVTSVTLSGAGRVKVGDTYTYTATLRLADGTVVSRPIAWSITNPARATITSSGVLTALQTGSFTIQLVIDGETWTSTYTAYDWDYFTSSGSQFVVIEADNTITNRLGTVDYADLIFSCTSTGYFFVWVSTPHIITANGVVALSFDGGAPYSEVWDELSPNYRTLWKPGSNSVVKGFAVQIQNARIFGFAFGEFLGSAKAMLFRVSGLGALLPPLFSACPGSAISASSIAADAIDIQSELDAQRTILAARLQGPAAASMQAEAAQRASRVGPIAMPSAGLTTLLDAMTPLPVVPSQPAHRRR